MTDLTVWDSVPPQLHLVQLLANAQRHLTQLRHLEAQVACVVGCGHWWRNHLCCHLQAQHTQPISFPDTPAGQQFFVCSFVFNKVPAKVLNLSHLWHPSELPHDYSHAMWELLWAMCLCDIFQALINSVVCWCCTQALGLFCFRLKTVDTK